MLKRSCQDGSLWDSIVKLSPFVFTDGKGEAAITNQLHDQVDRVPIE